MVEGRWLLSWDDVPGREFRPPELVVVLTGVREREVGERGG